MCIFSRSIKEIGQIGKSNQFALSPFAHKKQKSLENKGFSLYQLCDTMMVGAGGLGSLCSPCLLRKRVRFYVPFADAKDGLKVRIHPTSKKEHSQGRCLNCVLGGSGWIRTTEVVDNRFTVCPLWPLGNTPTFTIYFLPINSWSWWTDLNPRPADYKSAALPTELHQRFERSNIISNNMFIVKGNFYFLSALIFGVIID